MTNAGGEKNILKRSLPQSESDQEGRSLAPVVFQCVYCRAILTDTLAHNVEANAEEGTISTRAARGIAVSSQLCYSRKESDSFCSFNNISCSQCGAELGRHYVKTPPKFNYLKGTFVFNISNLSSYQLACCPVTSENCITEKPELQYQRPPKRRLCDKNVIAPADVDSLEDLTKASRHLKEALENVFFRQGLDTTERVQMHNMIQLLNEKFAHLDRRLRAVEESTRDVRRRNSK